MRKSLLLFLLAFLPFLSFSQKLVSVTPNKGFLGQNLNVTITGVNTHFKQGSGTNVYFNFGFSQGSSTSIVNAIYVTSPSSIVANITIPNNTYTGDYSVTVYDYEDGYLEINNAFHVNGLTPPTLNTVIPTSANNGQTLDVTITGANTHFNQGSGTNVYFDFGFSQGSSTTVVNSVYATSATSLVANISIPNNTYTGDYSIAVYDDIDGSMEIKNAFHVNGLTPPKLNSVSPISANNGQTLDVTITGANTHFNQGSGTTVNFDFGFSQGSGTTVVNSVYATSATSLVANISIPNNTYTGDYTVSVYSYLDGYIELNKGFRVNGITPPTLNSISPISAKNGQTLDVTITGANTHFNQGSGTTVDFDFGFSQGSGTTVVNSVYATSATSLVANITVPNNTYTGDYTFSVYNTIDGYLQKDKGFHVDGNIPASLNSISPVSANSGQTLDVTITGANTHFNQGSGTTVNFDFGFSQGSGTTIVNSVTALSPTTLIANISVPNNIYTGDYTFSVYNNIDGYLQLEKGFHVNGPKVFSGYVIPKGVSLSGNCDGSATVVLNGGTGPFKYQYSDGSKLASSFNLCEGLHSVAISDANGYSLYFDFIISSPTFTTKTTNFTDSLIIDSVYNSPISNCIIDYTKITSVSISSFSILPNNKVSVNWLVKCGSTNYNIIDTYSLGSSAGVYMVSLQLYCPTKSVGHYLTSYDQFYYNSSSAGIEQIKQTNTLIYPNPFSDFIEISLDNNESSEVIITDISGKTVLSRKFNDKLIKLNVDALSTGSYILTLKNNNKVLNKQIIK